MADTPATHRDLERVERLLHRIDEGLRTATDMLARIDERQAAQAQDIAGMAKAHEALQRRVVELEKVNSGVSARMAGAGAGAGGAVVGIVEAARLWIGW